MLTNRITTLMMAVLLGAGVPVASQAADDATKDLSSYQCKDFMRVGGSEREIAIAFLHGYLLGKAGSTIFSTDAAHKDNEQFIEHCLDNPNDKVIAAMSKFSKYPR